MPTIQTDLRGLRRRIGKLLALDEHNRRPPPVSLPGRPAKIIPPKPKPPPPMRIPNGAQHLTLRTSTRHAVTEQATDRDARATWPRAKLLRMNWKFSQRVERAFKRGTETRAAATAQFRK